MDSIVLDIVLSWINKEVNPEFKKENLFIVWSCYILGNKKYLIGCTDYSYYFEVTWNNNKKEYYLDVYSKVHNQVIDSFMPKN